MKMTKEEAIRNFREHWASLAITGSNDKEDYLRRHGFPHICCNCFLCEYAEENDIRDCDKCPVEWPETNTDMDYKCGRSFYGYWERAKSPEERKRLAAIIRDLPEKKEVKAEPKFKVGDKVVPVSKNVWFIGDPEPDCTSWKNGKFQREFLTVKRLANNDVRTLRGKIDGGQIYLCDGDYYLESDLRPYVEPEKTEYPKELQVEWVGGQPKLKVGDRVRVKSNGRVGTIKGIQDKWPPYIGVEFDEPIFNGHNFNDHLPKGKDGHCYFYNEGQLELLPINYCPEDKTVTVQTITIEFKGPKTICTIENQFGTFKGRAKCHPTNQWNEKTGADLALERAVEKFNEYQPDA